MLAPKNSFKITASFNNRGDLPIRRPNRAPPTVAKDGPRTNDEIRNLEVHYLTNPRGEVYFALLTDWADSKVEQSKTDTELLEYARERIDALNHHYTSTLQRFFLLHRRRLYNESEGCWMGWERKRGKLH